MSKILFVNACVRGEASRTLTLARTFLEEYAAAHPGDTITERNLMEERLQPQYPEILDEITILERNGRFDAPMFEQARQFVAADQIVIAAPFWDLSFPAILKIYLERVSVVGLTFGYGAEGESLGFCKAKALIYITTRGGEFSAPDRAWMEMGARQLKALCAMYGIPRFEVLAVEGLDDVRNDAQAILTDAMGRARELAREF